MPTFVHRNTRIGRSQIDTNDRSILFPASTDRIRSDPACLGGHGAQKDDRDEEQEHETRRTEDSGRLAAGWSAGSEEGHDGIGEQCAPIGAFAFKIWRDGPASVRWEAVTSRALAFPWGMGSG